ncbi:hypothetical protein SAMN02800692_2843 [Luteibacter sp. UNC138MFCol5.1]|uniref:hypothetical protein n=1 Tax=Luteibacter sp. UNC138MFCol5.1 TaxID=1502774 RepID=UPI0008B37089|nr:hypothetical protein [Luteibacter sp. UNC138MFCol5.1]SEO93038.1 hypothetical protein SAMN02800692_2843 [Luteibacter sp. UNC138MFCol5.1]
MTDPATTLLASLRLAREAVEQAARDTAVVADELRRYQKFAKPGQPSAQIVRLRQQQAAARQASARAKQAFILAARRFIEANDLVVPPKTTLDVFAMSWLDAHPDGT